ncbi:MAG: DMT family transporter [Burkholderiaceae bacterium]|nr:DMT family transporter [Burkholderiaceae bacterium]
MSTGQWLLLLATSASFAASILLNKVLVGQLPPFTLAALRVLLAMPIGLAAAMLLGRPLPRERRDRVAVVAASLGVIVVPYCALAIGQQTIASGLSAILYSLTPLFTLLIAHAVLHDERLGAAKLAGIGLGILGVIAVIGPSALGGLGAHLIAELITLCGPLAYATGTVLMRRSRPIDPVAMTAGMFVAATVILVPLALAIERPWTVRGDAVLVAMLIAMAIFGTIVPAALNYLLVQRVGATRASIAMFLMPLIAVFLGAVLLDERLDASAFVGLALIVGGSLLITRVPRAAPGRAEPDVPASPP